MSGSTGTVESVAAVLRERRSFLLTSHARPDGDAIGSSMALGLALTALGKDVTIALHDAIPVPYEGFPNVDQILITDRFAKPVDAVVFLECSDPTRPEIAGLESYFTVNIDHHLGNTMYGAINWFDESAAACGELVAELIDALGVPWSTAIAAHLYLALATDTGSFRFGPVSARTFDTCRRISEAGVSTSDLARQIFDSFSIGRVKLTGALLNTMELHHNQQLAVLCFDDELLRSCGASVDDTEGLVNLPLGAREVAAVLLFKRQEGDVFRVSLRSKGTVDVRSVAAAWAGGGHHNAAGCTVHGPYEDIKLAMVRATSQAIDAAR
ncbi:MAG: bifunctional oligoribonuclease/PAP phosphatase NrnA [Vicinamibacterales bacterium]